MRAFSPNQIKADVIFGLSVAACFGLKLSSTQEALLLGASGAIAVAANFAEAHVHVGGKIVEEVKELRADVASVLPVLSAAAHDLPGKVGEEVSKAIEVLQGTVPQAPAHVEAKLQPPVGGDARA